MPDPPPPQSPKASTVPEAGDTVKGGSPWWFLGHEPFELGLGFRV